MLDALYHAYVAPKHIPPGAFVPEDWRRRLSQRAMPPSPSVSPVRLPVEGAALLR
jgi:hypothetical protein